MEFLSSQPTLAGQQKNRECEKNPGPTFFFSRSAVWLRGRSLAATHFLGLSRSQSPSSSKLTAVALHVFCGVAQVLEQFSSFSRPGALGDVSERNHGDQRYND